MQNEYRVTKLKNGARIATSFMPWMRSSSIGVWAGVGGRHESLEELGLSHFVEHLLFKGTKRRNARQLTADVEGVGGYLNAFTSEDHTCYYAKTCADHFERLCDVLGDMYTQSQFPADEIEREREVIREEILMVKDQPSQHAQELLSEALWPNHPLGRPLTGTVESIAKFKRRDFQSYVRQRYSGRSTVVAVAGNVTHEQAVAALAPIFSKLPSGDPIRFKAAKPPTEGTRLRLCTDDTEQVQLALGFVSFGRRDPKRFALKLLSVVLGENMSSRLFQQLREKHGYCYSVHSCVSTFAETGMFGIAAGLDVSKLKPSMKLIQREIERVRSKVIGKRELQEAKDYAIGQTLLGLESTTNQMMWMGESILGYERVVDSSEVESQLKAVTAADVHAVANEVFDTATRAGIAAVGPLKDLQPALEILRS